MSDPSDAELFASLVPERIVVDAAAFEAFQAALDEPITDPAGLIALLASRPVWEGDHGRVVVADDVEPQDEGECPQCGEVCTMRFEGCGPWVEEDTP